MPFVREPVKAKTPFFPVAVPTTICGHFVPNQHFLAHLLQRSAPLCSYFSLSCVYLCA
jgi:hypothetical protein